MANTNTLSAVIPQLLAMGLDTLRQQAIMPRLVNRGYEEVAGEKGSTITIPVPSAITTQDVTPSYVPPDDAGVVPTTVTISLDQWKEAPFFMTDKDMLEVQAGVIPGQAAEAIKSLANTIDSAILGLYTGVYGYAGTAGTTPFASDLSAYTAARKVLNKQLAPMNDRRVVLDPDAEEKAINLRAFQDASFRGDVQGIQEGQIGRKLGSDWFMDQNVKTHTAGTITTGLAAKAATAQAVGDKTIVCTTAASTGACALVAGDIVTFGANPQTYVLTAAATEATAATDVTLNIEPGLKVALAGGEAVAVKASHVVNLNFQRDAFAFVSRPFAASDPLGLGTFQSAVDPISGIALRLEATRQHKRTRWSFDILYGVKLVRPELAARIAG